MKIIRRYVLPFMTLMANAKNIKPRVLSCKLSPDIAYPFQAILIIAGQFACTATLITRIHLLTVASCVAQLIQYKESLTKVEIRLGSIQKENGNTYRVGRISHHPGFYQPYPDFYIRDIAVIHLTHFVPVSDDVAPVILPSHRSNVLFKVLVLFSALAGKNTTSEGVSSLLIRILANTETIQACQKSFTSYFLTKGQVCIEINPEFQYGSVDKGGPLLDIAETTILGLASSGTNDSGLNGIPKIFTKVSEYIPYIIDELSYGTRFYSPVVPAPAITFTFNNDILY